MGLGEDILEHVSVDVRQATIGAVVAESQACVINAEEMENRGVDVVDRGGVLAIQRFEAPDVARPERCSSPDAATRHPGGEAEGIVIATHTILCARHTAELRGPQE